MTHYVTEYIIKYICIDQRIFCAL